eukprot:2867782-Amphidinium_carterae.2
MSATQEGTGHKGTEDSTCNSFTAKMSQQGLCTLHLQCARVLWGLHPCLMLPERELLGFSLARAQRSREVASDGRDPVR